MSAGVKKTLLTAGAPEPLKTQVEVANPSLGYEDLRAMVENYISARASWKPIEPRDPSSSDQSVATEGVPMEVAVVRKGKGKEKSRPTASFGQFGGNCLRCGAWGHRAAECVEGPCHRCGLWGHSAANCPLNQGGDWQENDGVNWDIRCWCCHVWGHRENVCPSKGHAQGQGKPRQCGRFRPSLQQAPVSLS